MSKVVIFGTGDFAQVAQVYLATDSPHEVVAFTVDQQYITESELLGKPVVPFETLTETYPPNEYSMFVAIGFSKVNKARAAIYQRCKDLGYKLISYVNSKAIVWHDLEIGDNSFVFEANVIQPFVRIGSNTIIWSGNHIGHHTQIGSHIFIASHAVISGGVTVGDYCFLGVNATIADGVTLTPSCVIGAGALITADTEEEGVYKGVKAELSRIKSSQLRGF
jgi:sugar O-acyltransferase (sialic acid O-acetyltransferase NeuD family)